MQKTLAEIAKHINGKVVGSSSLVIKGVNGVEQARKGEITFLSNRKYVSSLKKTQASAVIVSSGIGSLPGKSLIQVKNPSLAFSKVIGLFVGKNSLDIKGIHPTAIIDKTAKISKNVAIGCHVVIRGKVSIGKNCVIHAGTFVGDGTVLGDDCIIYPNVTIRENVQIGNKVIIHSGTVIGDDGFGYELIDGNHKKIPQVGTVVIEDDVEIGCNVTIDRARFDKTLIGRGTKIDNLVHIAHNVTIGENCIIVAQVGISGSVVIGKGAILAGQAGVVGHLTIGEGAVVTAQAGVTKSVPAHMTVSGFPAREHKQFQKAHAALQILPQYIETIRELKKRIEKLEGKS